MCSSCMLSPVTWSTYTSLERVKSASEMDSGFSIASDLIGFLYQNIVAIYDVLVLHALARYLEHVHVFGAGEVGERNGLGILHRFQRTAGGDASHQRQAHPVLGARRRSHGERLLHASPRLQQIDGAAAIVVAAQQSLLLQVGDVLVHGRQRAEAEPLGNLFERWRIAVLVHELGDEIVHLFLTASECHGRAQPSASIVSEQKAKSQQRISTW